jgi:hypothetical protein
MLFSPHITVSVANAQPTAQTPTATISGDKKVIWAAVAAKGGSEILGPFGDALKRNQLLTG